MSINYSSFLLPESELNGIRKVLYSPTGDGFYVLKGFLPENIGQHIRRFWSEIIDTSCLNRSFCYKTRNEFFFGHPNVYRVAKDDTHDVKVFHNYLWNYPHDEVTHQIAHMVISMINQLERKPIYHELHPMRYRSDEKDAFKGCMLSYRVIQTFNNATVPEHRDFGKDDPHNCFPEKLNATLILSEHGKDYGGEGMSFTTNAGRKLILNKDLQLTTGDLLLWRYANLHGVDGVKSEAGQKGFMRIIYPREGVYDYAPEKDKIEEGAHVAAK